MVGSHDPPRAARQRHRLPVPGVDKRQQVLLVRRRLLRAHRQSQWRAEWRLRREYRDGSDNHLALGRPWS